jgi:hypothetical protein
MRDREPLPENGPALERSNRRVLAERLGWPAGALEECEQLDAAYPGWSITWSPGNTVRGFERPAGFYGVDRNYKGWAPVHAYGATPAELVADIIALTGSGGDGR